ncbi:hypothetical protein BH11PSE12_BH11PSE12_21780 [soil metagenome]
MENKFFSKKSELEQILGVQKNLLDEKVSEYISLTDALSSLGVKYHFQSQEQQDFYRTFEQDFGKKNIGIFHKIVMLELMNQFPARVQKLKIPLSIVEMFHAEFERIVNLIGNDSNFVFDWTNDFFAKDMGICTFRIIPAGAQLVEISGVPRRVILRNLSQLPAALPFFLFKTKGFKPFYEIHTHSGNLTEFSLDGWNRCYVRIGELLKLNPEIKGMLGGSWFYDPFLSVISPRLEYLRGIPCENGAKVFFSQDEGADSSALSKSESRKKMYVDGKYTPKAFLLVWARDDLINFSERNAKLLSASVEQSKPNA